MPRFFFHIHDGVELPDTVGVELAGWKQAKEASIRYAGTIIADNAKTTKLGEDWTMEVTDDTGLILFRLDFHIAASSAIAGTTFRAGGSSAGRSKK